MDYHIVWRVERARVVIVEQRSSFMRPFCFHVDQARRFAQRALCTQYESITIVGAAVGHKVALRTSYFITSEICRGKEFDFGDDYGLVMCCYRVGRRVRDLV